MSTENVKSNWLSSPITIVAIITVALNSMGFLAVRTFNVRMHLPASFIEDTPISYLQWGAKAVVLLIINIVELTVLITLITLIVSQTLFRLNAISKWTKLIQQWFQTKASNLKPSTKLGLLFTFSIIIFLAFFISQNQIFQEIMVDENCSQFTAPTVFSSSNNDYKWFSTFVIIVLGIVLIYCNRIKKDSIIDKHFSNLFIAAIFSIWLLIIAFWIMPYRLMNDNEYEEVTYKKMKAFVLAEKDTRLFLYIPQECPFVIDKKDILLDRSGKRYYNNIFK